MRRVRNLMGLVAFAYSLSSPNGWAADDRVIALSDRAFRQHGRSISATFQVAATPHQAYAVLVDHAHMADYMPMVADVTLLGARPGWARVRFHLRYLAMFDIVEIDERTFDPDRRIQWHATEGPLKTSDGSWTFTVQGHGTRVVYQTDVDPGVPIPSSLTAAMVKRGLVEFLEGVRRRIESGGTWRKAS